MKIHYDAVTGRTVAVAGRLIAGSLALLAVSTPCQAHGLAGQRFFPATLAVDDPSVADEGDILYGHSRTPADAGGDVTADSLAIGVGKRITPNFGLSLASEYDTLRFSNGDPTQRGLANLSIGAKYLALVNEPHEAMLSLGLSASLGRTGSGNIADRFSTISPGIFFGKGFGDLDVAALRPVAVTGVVAPNFTTQRTAPNSLDWGFTFQYNLQYLQAFVKDAGLSQPLNHMIPLVEAAMNTCLDRGCSGQTTGTINPGVIWFSHWGQLGAECTIPVNRRTGARVGVLMQVHFYFDDIFPDSYGKPLFP